MRRSDFDTSAAQLHSAMDDLQLAWQVAAESWDDSVSRQFAQQHLDPLLPARRMALDAVSRMRELVFRIENECRE